MKGQLRQFDFEDAIICENCGDSLKFQTETENENGECFGFFYCDHCGSIEDGSVVEILEDQEQDQLLRGVA